MEWGKKERKEKGWNTSLLLCNIADPAGGKFELTTEGKERVLSRTGIIIFPSLGGKKAKCSTLCISCRGE